MKHIFAFAYLALSVSACASTSLKPSPISSPNKQALSAQYLEEGECGLFFWTKSSPRNFVFFHQRGQPTAKYFTHGEETNLQVTHGRFAPSESSALTMVYNTAHDKAVNVQGQFSQTVEGGIRIPNGSITMQNNDGWEEIVPVSGIYVCQ